MAMQIRGTVTPNDPPSGLVERQLSVEMGSTPPKLWVGVPTAIDPSGRLQLLPQDLSAYVTSTALTTALANYLPLTSLPLSVANGGTGTTTFPITQPAGLNLLSTFVQASGTTALTPASSAQGVIGSWSNAGIGAVGFGAHGYVDLRRANGTAAAPSAVLNDQMLGAVFFSGYGASAFTYDGGSAIRGHATENWTDTAQGSVVDFLTTSNGSGTALVALTISNAGSTVASPISIGWMDDWAFGIRGITPQGVWVDPSGNLFVDGNIHYAGTLTPSDARLKEAVEPYTAGLDAINRLAPISFAWNDKGGMAAAGRHVGLAAEDAEQVMPEMVRRIMVKLEPPRGQPDTDILTVDPAYVTYALVNAVKELARRVAALE